MNQKTFSLTAGVIFSLVALLHGLRLVFGWEVIFAGWMVPPMVVPGNPSTDPQCEPPYPTLECVCAVLTGDRYQAPDLIRSRPRHRPILIKEIMYHTGNVYL